MADGAGVGYCVWEGVSGRISFFWTFGGGVPEMAAGNPISEMDQYFIISLQRRARFCPTPAGPER